MYIIPDEIVRRLSKQQFEMGANHPNTWGFAAQKLLIAADLLVPHIKEAEERRFRRALETKPETVSHFLSEEEQYDLHMSMTLSIWVMLIALAFENLIKGIFVSKRASPRTDGKLPADGHDLVYLAKSAELNLTETEQKLLLMLSEYIVWRGRYNIPKTSNDLYQKEKRRPKRSGTISLGHMDNAIKSCAKMRARLIEEFQAARETWPGLKSR